MSELLKKTITIREWAEDDRPREKLLLKGRAFLSDAELLAILIGTGTRQESAVDLAKKMLLAAENNLNELGRLSIKDLTRTKGIGEAKAASVLAALELGRRRKENAVHERKQVVTSRDAFDYFQPSLADNKHEEFWILLLSRSNKILAARQVSSGGVSGTVADTRIIFKHALDVLASAVILCHNHPSGSIKPSEADIQLTRKMVEAGRILDVSVVDHIIVGERQYYSFSDEGMI